MRRERALQRGAHLVTTTSLASALFVRRAVMADRWGTVVGIVNMIKFSNLWGDYVQDFLPRADQPSLQVKLDDAQAAIMLEHDEELLRTLGCTEPVDVTNAVAAANGKMLQLPARAGEDEEPTEPRGRFAPRRCRQPVVLMTAERKCTTCGRHRGVPLPHCVQLFYGAVVRGQPRGPPPASAAGPWFTPGCVKRHEDQRCAPASPNHMPRTPRSR